MSPTPPPEVNRPSPRKDAIRRAIATRHRPGGGAELSDAEIEAMAAEHGLPAIPPEGRLNDGGLMIFACRGCGQTTIYAHGLCTDCQLDVAMGGLPGASGRDDLELSEDSIQQSPTTAISPGRWIATVHVKLDVEADDETAARAIVRQRIAAAGMRLDLIGPGHAVSGVRLDVPLFRAHANTERRPWQHRVIAASANR